MFDGLSCSFISVILDGLSCTFASLSVHLAILELMYKCNV